MRHLGKSLASVCHPRNVLCAILVAASVWAVGVGFVPIGPKPSEAVEARLVTQVSGPSANDRQVARLVRSNLREHLSKHALDDEISRRALDLFLKYVDSQKLYFYQSDVDEFRQRRNDIDDMINSGDVSFAYTVFNRFL